MFGYLLVCSQSTLSLLRESSRSVLETGISAIEVINTFTGSRVTKLGSPGVL